VSCAPEQLKDKQSVYKHHLTAAVD